MPGGGGAQFAKVAPAPHPPGTGFHILCQLYGLAFRSSGSDRRHGHVRDDARRSVFCRFQRIGYHDSGAHFCTQWSFL